MLPVCGAVFLDVFLCHQKLFKPLESIEPLDPPQQPGQKTPFSKKAGYILYQLKLLMLFMFWSPNIPVIFFVFFCIIWFRNSKSTKVKHSNCQALNFVGDIHHCASKEMNKQLLQMFHIQTSILPTSAFLCWPSTFIVFEPSGRKQWHHSFTDLDAGKSQVCS